MDEFEKHAARAFFASAWADMVEENGATLQGEIMDQMPAEIDPAAMEYFGHYAAMQAMGHGVGLHDAFGQDAYLAITVPDLEFGSCHLERDYTA